MPNDPDRGESFAKGKKSAFREAKTLSKFTDNAYIVAIRDFFYENNTTYLVMDYIDGQTLKDYIKDLEDVVFPQNPFVETEKTQELTQTSIGETNAEKIPPIIDQDAFQPIDSSSVRNESFQDKFFSIKGRINRKPYICRIFMLALIQVIIWTFIFAACMDFDNFGRLVVKGSWRSHCAAGCFDFLLGN